MTPTRRQSRIDGQTYVCALCWHMSAFVAVCHRGDSESRDCKFKVMLKGETRELYLSAQPKPRGIAVQPGLCMQLSLHTKYYCPYQAFPSSTVLLSLLFSRAEYLPGIRNSIGKHKAAHSIGHTRSTISHSPAFQAVVSGRRLLPNHALGVLLAFDSTVSAHIHLPHLCPTADPSALFRRSFPPETSLFCRHVALTIHSPSRVLEEVHGASFQEWRSSS